MHIRRFKTEDWYSVWAIIEPVFREGETYVYAPGISESEARHIWTKIPLAAFVACDDDGSILGTYYIKPNQPGLGSHVCNCGYIVSSKAQGKGVASAMCLHSQDFAKENHFRAMQFNFVVSTNTGAVNLWTKLGFHIVGTLPKAYQHQKLGFVDALIMFKEL